MPTASIMVRATKIKSLPHWFNEAPVGDMYLQIISSIKSGALYIPDIMCAYRHMSTGSWGKNMLTLDEIVVRNKVNSHIKCLSKIDELTLCKYKKNINYALARELQYCSVMALKNSYYDYYRELISLSVHYYKAQSLTQTLLFNLRFTRFLAKFVFQSGSFLKKYIARF